MHLWCYTNLFLIWVDNIVGECFFWFQLIRVVPDKIQRAVKRLCACVLTKLIQQKTAWQKMTQTNIDKFERPTERVNFNSEHMLDLTGEDMDWSTKCQRTRQRFRQIDGDKAKLEQSHCYLHTHASVSLDCHNTSSYGPECVHVQAKCPPLGQTASTLSNENGPHSLSLNCLYRTTHLKFWTLFACIITIWVLHMCSY